MQNPFVHGVGGVLSADIAVPDHKREVEFYSNILTTGDAPLWRDDLMNNLGTPIVGLGARTPEYDSLPLQWMPHFQVADVAVSAASAIEMGGKELMHGKDDAGKSQWAVLLDPDGAAFGIIPVVHRKTASQQPDGQQQDEQQGSISWLSLVVPNASSSSEFYQQVIGWNAISIETEESEGLSAKYEMQIDDERSAAEICQLAIEQSEIPPVWLIHLPVDGFAESLQRVHEHGGKVIENFSDAKRSVIRDPVGVFLALQAAE